MRLHWFGHACFLIESSSGQQLVTDPYNSKVGYETPVINPDLVTVSHSHFDHNAVEVLQGTPRVISGTGEWQVGDFLIEGLASYHDDCAGAKRGPNTIFIITVDGLSIAHLGDLGHQLDRELTAKLSGIDVLLVPVGGTYTIDGAAAEELRRKLQPRLTIPMHYLTPSLGFPLASVEAFLDASSGYGASSGFCVAETCVGPRDNKHVTAQDAHLKQAAIELHQGLLPVPGTVWVLDYSPTA